MRKMRVGEEYGIGENKRGMNEKCEIDAIVKGSLAAAFM